MVIASNADGAPILAYEAGRKVLRFHYCIRQL